MGVLAALAFLASTASADVELRVDARSHEIAERLELGSVIVEGVGAVSVVAQREGKRVVLRAGGPDGTALGRAEAPIGLDSTPIFVTTPRGLEKIVVVWEGGAGEEH